MPSLDALSRDRLAVRMVDLLTGDRGRVYEDRALMTNLARLVDRSVVRYREASGYLDEWIETRHLGNESARFRGVSAIEECITLVHRAGRYADVLMRRDVIDPTLMPSANDRKPIKDMRDAIQHLEDRILGTRKPPIRRGEPSFPSFGPTAVELGSQSLSYQSLSATITALHEAVGSPFD
jgi:hypothetical protein